MSVLPLTMLLLAAPPAIETATEPDGLDLVAVERPSRLCSIRLAVRAGANEDPPNKQGLAHLVEHLQFRGEEGEQCLLSPYSRVNAFTSVGGTIYVVDTNSDHCEAELTRLLSAVTAGRLPRPWVRRELGVIKREAVYTPDLLDVAVFGDGNSHVLGTPRTRDEISHQDVVHFYQAHYRPENMALVTVGPLDLAAVRRAIDHGFKLPPSVSGEKRRARAPEPFVPAGENTLSSVSPGLIALVTALSLDRISACRSLAALVELRLTQKLRPGSATVESSCRAVLGNLMLGVYIHSEPRDQRRAHDLALAEWVSLKAPTPAEAKLVAHRLESEAQSPDAAVPALVSVVAETALWRRGEPLFTLVPQWLATDGPSGKVVAEVRPLTQLSASTVVQGSNQMVESLVSDE